jgi:hypothetical protein
MIFFRRSCVILSLIFVLSSCARYSYINFHPQIMGQLPEKIIWIQLPGLTMSSLALYKFTLEGQEETLAFERSTCLGSTWDFNHYLLRPPAEQGLMAQLSGSKDIRGSCEDLKRGTLWDFLKQERYQSTVVRTEDTLQHLYQCKEEDKKNYFAQAVQYNLYSAATENSKVLPLSGVEFPVEGEIYYEESCQSSKCFENPAKTFQSIVDKTLMNSGRRLYLFQDLRLSSALARKKSLEVIDILKDYNDALEELIKMARNNKNILLLLSGTAGMPLELPSQGREWERFFARGEAVTFKKQSATTPLFAWGARSENFCGFYNESDIIQRISQSPDQGSVRYYIFNPLN